MLPPALFQVARHLRASRTIVSVVFVLASASTGASQTTYPVIDPRYSFAGLRHQGETRLGTIGIAKSAQVSAQAEYSCAEPLGGGCALRFRYAFGSTSPEEFVVPFFTIGRSAIDTVRPDGTPGAPVILSDDATLNLTNVMLNARDSGVSIEAIRLVLRPVGSPGNLQLRLEVKDGRGQASKRLVAVTWNGSNAIAVTVPITSLSGAADLTRVKQLGLVIEENHFGDGVTNPQAAVFDIERLELLDTDGPNISAS